QRVDNGAFFNDDIAESAFFGLQATGNANGSPTNNDNIKFLHYAVFSFRSLMVSVGFSLLKTKLPATKTSAPCSTSFLALSAFTPPSISIKALEFFLWIRFFRSFTFW